MQLELRTIRSVAGTVASIATFVALICSALLWLIG